MGTPTAPVVYAHGPARCFPTSQCLRSRATFQLAVRGARPEVFAYLGAVARRKMGGNWGKLTQAFCVLGAGRSQ